jgi:uncharacterized protein (TIGR00297 family)
MEINKILLYLINILIAVYSLKKKKLTLLGTLAAFLIGLITIETGFEFFFIVLTFFLTSTTATKIGSKYKKQILDIYKTEKVRNIYQVLCNGLIPTLICIYLCINKHFGFVINKQNTENALLLAYMSYYACCTGDTWASELGVLSKRDPYLITNFRRVPRGTNGGVSLWGTFMSVLGGLTIGIVTGLLSILRECPEEVVGYVIRLSVCGAFMGFLGSLIDSLLGATVQQTIICTREFKVKYVMVTGLGSSEEEEFGIDILDNNLVNLISATMTSIISIHLIDMLT